MRARQPAQRRGSESVRRARWARQALVPAPADLALALVQPRPAQRERWVAPRSLSAEVALPRRARKPAPAASRLAAGSRVCWGSARSRKFPKRDQTPAMQAQLSFATGGRGARRAFPLSIGPAVLRQQDVSSVGDPKPARIRVAESVTPVGTTFVSASRMRVQAGGASPFLRRAFNAGNLRPTQSDAPPTTHGSKLETEACGFLCETSASSQFNSRVIAA